MKVRNARAIGAIVRERRRELGLDQQTLANRIDASRYWVVQVEQGKDGAEVGRVLRALDALGLSVDIAVPGAPNTSVGKQTTIQIPTFDIDAIVDSARRQGSVVLQSTAKMKSSVKRKGK